MVRPIGTKFKSYTETYRYEEDGSLPIKVDTRRDVTEFRVVGHAFDEYGRECEIVQEVEESPDEYIKRIKTQGY